MGFRPIFYIKKYKPVSTSTADDMASDVYLSHSHRTFPAPRQVYKRVQDFFRGQVNKDYITEMMRVEQICQGRSFSLTRRLREVHKPGGVDISEAYTFKSYEDEANLSSKKQSKWFKNKKNMNKFKKTSVSLGNSLKSCLLLLLSCFHV
ncbi:hypothetical protein IGI04_033768 [Brassica rapa subsp. trilocularis]|uniref:Uncharacterized protein n=1 Tax=Brassica rapa subsp. trilocularis TaxID=1813537 RepID=A0ABQ7L6T5_BRACM|nr:hypothetical protein IGI04_033768 [Brassica rapa subsp. trilocularis]